jgi:hypothetical protein
MKLEASGSAYKAEPLRKANRESTEYYRAASFGKVMASSNFIK